jgi:3-phenylpropionate/cinnamic acid dioxygenase small subunit
VKSTQALAQAQSAQEEQQRKEEQEKLDLQVKWEEEKAQLQQRKDQLLVEKLETEERVHKALRSVTIIEVKMEDRLPQQVTQLEEVI